MNLEKLREQLEIDEGVKYEIYRDHLGYATFGIGHLVLESDPEYGQDVGTSIDTVRVHQAFESDCESVLRDCNILYEDFDDLPEEVQQEMVDSSWYRQVTNRADRLVERMRKAHPLYREYD